MEGLTAKQEAFAKAYVETLNASEAYRRAYPGSEKWTPKALHSKASAMLAKDRVAGRVAELQAKTKQIAEQKHEVTVERIVRELSLIGFSNMADYITTQADGSAYVDLSELSREQAAAISEVTSETYTEGRGEDAQVVKRTKFKLSDKRAALVDLGKHLGMFKEIHEHTGKDGAPIELNVTDLTQARRVAFALGRALERQKMKVIDGEAG